MSVSADDRAREIERRLAHTGRWVHFDSRFVGEVAVPVVGLSGSIWSEDEESVTLDAVPAVLEVLPIPTGSIGVSPFGGMLTPGLEFDAGASAGAGELLQARFGYSVESVLAGPLIQARLAMTGSSATGDGVATVVGDLCLGEEFSFDVDACFTSTETLIVFDTGMDALLSERRPLPAVATLGVITDISVDGGLSGSAAIAAAKGIAAVREAQANVRSLQS